MNDSPLAQRIAAVRNAVHQTAQTCLVQREDQLHEIFIDAHRVLSDQPINAFLAQKGS
jgi:hypothetical protein